MTGELSFRNIAWAHIFFQPCRSNNYWEILGKSPSDIGFDLRLFLFLNGWQCRITKNSLVRYEILSTVNKIWDKIQPRVFKFDFINQGNMQSELFDRLSNIRWLNKDGSHRSLGPTATSKILHVLRPDVFVMWDAPIRDHYGLDGSFSSYQKFNSMMREQAVRIVELILAKSRERDSVEHMLSTLLCNRLRCNHPRFLSLTKLIDEYNWLAITNRIDDDRIAFC